MLLRQLLQSGFLSISWPLALQVGGCPPTVLWVLENVCWLANICLPAGSIGLLWVVFQSCVILSPEVRWFGSIPWFGFFFARLLVVKWMGSIYTSMVFLRNECSCFHVRGAAVLGTDSLSGARCYFLVVQYWEDSEWPFCFTCCFAVFVVSPLCFQKAQSFCELKFALFVPRIYSLSSLSAISKRIRESPVCDVS